MFYVFSIKPLSIKVNVNCKNKTPCILDFHTCLQVTRDSPILDATK